MSEIADFLLDNDNVTAIGLYIEGFRDMHAFEAMAIKALCKKKQ